MIPQARMDKRWAVHQSVAKVLPPAMYLVSNVGA